MSKDVSIQILNYKSPVWKIKQGYSEIQSLGWMRFQLSSWDKGPSQQLVSNLTQIHQLSFQHCGRLAGSCSTCTKACKALMAKAWQKELCVEPQAFSKDLKVKQAHTCSHKCTGPHPGLHQEIRGRLSTAEATSDRRKVPEQVMNLLQTGCNLQGL